MKKQYMIIALSLLLTGCDTLLTPDPIQYSYVEDELTPNAPNPYDKMNAKQVARLSDNAICENLSEASQQRFKINKLIQREYTKRGLKDCSEAEIFCLRDAGLKVGTEKFAFCKMKFMEQQNQNYYKEQEIAFQQQQQIQQQERESRARERATLYAMGEALSHSHDNMRSPFSSGRGMSCTSRSIGYSVQTDCY